jgi:ABC-type transport system involved in multi-copper enzyme maturation permease subunit
MSFTSPILTVAKFEVKTLLRSWFFRIFSAIIIVFLLFFNIVESTEVGNSGFEDRILPGGLVYMNLWILNIVQSIIAVFLSSDFLSRDKKLDTTEVIYTRSMSNFEYVFGKTLGIFYVFGGLNLLVLAFTFVINVISPDAGFSLLTYLIYPFIISIPTLIFVLGVSFFVMQLVKNQAITFILVLGYIAICLFYLKSSSYGVWDFLGFFTPMAYSSYIGLGNFTQLLFVRGGYLLIGLSFMFLTVYKLPRLSQTAWGKKIMILPAFVLLVIALGGILTYLLNKNTIEKELQQMALLEKKLPINAGYSISHYDIQIEQEKDVIRGITQFTLSSDNNQYPEQLVFYFNKGLNIRELKINNQEADFKRQLNFLTIENKQLSKAELSITVDFEGTPDDQLAYFDLDKEKREELHRFNPLLGAKKSLFVSDKYLLLTSENFWYPVVADRNALRVSKFFTSTVKVKANNRMTYLCQGEKADQGDWLVFKGDRSYTKLSLVGAPFIQKSLQVDSLKYSVLVKDGNNFYEKYFENLEDTLPVLVTQLKEDYERELGVVYPYKRLNFVEVPLHFYAYYRSWALVNENTSPEMVFVPERGVGIDMFNLSKHKNRAEKNNKRDGTEMLPKELEANLFVNLVGNTFAKPTERRRFFGGSEDAGRSMSNWSSYSLFPLFYNYCYSIKENELPFYNMCLESYMLSRIQSSSFNPFGNLSGNDKSILFLKENKKSLTELVDEEDLKISIADIILTVGNNKFAAAQQRVGLDNFDFFIDSLLSKYRGKAIAPELLQAVIGEEDSEKEVTSSAEMKLPAFIFGEAEVYEFKDSERTNYFIGLEVSNVGDQDGLIKASLYGGRGQGGGNRGGSGQTGGNRNSGGGNSGQGRGGTMTASFENIYRIQKGQNIKIGMIVSDAPRRMSLHTYLAQNVPSDIIFPLADFTEAPKGLVAFSGVRDLNDQVRYEGVNEIIVDNEDPGFSVVNNKGRKTLKEIVLASRDEEVEDDEFEYKTLSPWNPAGRWTPVLSSLGFGKYTKSYVYKKGGDGNAKAQFKAQLKESGRYNVYAMMPSQRIGSFRRQKQPDGNYIYTIYHDDGEDTVEIPVDQDDSDWVYLGEFYYSDGEAIVELSDQTNRRVVVADAVKWVKL